MSHGPVIGGKLREETSGADRSQAGFACWGSDPVKEISQTCGLNVIVRRMATSDRSMVTAEKLVCSAWKFIQPGDRNGKAIYRDRFAPQPVHLLHSAGKRTNVRHGMGTGGSGEVRQEAPARRRSGGGDHRQHKVIFRRGGAACGARGGGQYEPVSCDPAVGEEDGSQRRADAGIVSVEEHVAGGAHEG